MTESEQRLLKLLCERSFRRGYFGLARGGRSDCYIDGKMCEVYSAAARLIGEVIYERTRGLRVDALGGPGTGAIPLVTAAVVAYDLRGERMEGFWMRRRVKKHGTRKLIEGRLCPGYRVVILDDVVTTGRSVLRAVFAARVAGAEVVQVLTLVDRLGGAGRLLLDYGVADYQTVFTAPQLAAVPST